MSQPLSVSTNGTTGAWWVPVLIDPSKPKLTELTAPGVLNIAGYLTGDGLNEEVSENNIEDPRLNSKQIFESPGDFTRTLELKYVINPQVPTDDQARIKLAQGAQGYIVVRPAVDAEEALAVGDLVRVYPVKLGVQKPQASARNSVHMVSQKPFVVGSVADMVAVVA